MDRFEGVAREDIEISVGIEAACDSAVSTGSWKIFAVDFTDLVAVKAKNQITVAFVHGIPTIDAETDKAVLSVDII